MAAWLQDFPTPAWVGGVVLTARTLNGQIYGFPRSYDIFVPSKDNSNWSFVGRYTQQPEPITHEVYLNLPQRYLTYGAMIVGRTLGRDNYDLCYLQMAEIALTNHNSAESGEDLSPCPAFDPSAPYAGYCTERCQCAEGQGDSDRSSQCGEGLFCGNDNGAD